MRMLAIQNQREHLSKRHIEANGQTSI